MKYRTRVKELQLTAHGLAADNRGVINHGTVLSVTPTSTCALIQVRCHLKDASSRSHAARAVAAFLGAEMKARGLSQNALAKLSGVSQQHVGRLLRMTAEPTTEILERLSIALDVPISSFVSGQGAPRQNTPGTSPQEAKRVAFLVAAFIRCDEKKQRLLVEMAEALAMGKDGK